MQIESIKKALRGTVVHKVYVLCRYDLYLFLFFRFYQSLRQKKGRKILRYLRERISAAFSERPGTIAVDVVSCCNLRCPLCSVPPFLVKKNGNFMTLEDFKAAVGNINIGSDLCLVYAGEPFLNPDFFEMVHQVSESFYVSTITNGTLLNRRNIRAVLDSGLDFLQISFDGFSRESYEKYRVGADFEKVRNGILDLIRARREEKRRVPHITITFLVNAYNENELNGCRRFFLGKGADRFFSKAINLNVHRRLDGKKEKDLKDWLPRRREISLYEEQDGKVLFRSRDGVCTTCMNPIIRCDGEVLICCHDVFNTVKIGNIHESDLRSLWFSEGYRETRRRAKQRLLPICRQCGK